MCIIKQDTETCLLCSETLFYTVNLERCMGWHEYERPGETPGQWCSRTIHRELKEAYVQDCADCRERLRRDPARQAENQSNERPPQRYPPRPSSPASNRPQPSSSSSNRPQAPPPPPRRGSRGQNTVAFDIPGERVPRRTHSLPQRQQAPPPPPRRGSRTNTNPRPDIVQMMGIADPEGLDHRSRIQRWLRGPFR